MKHSLFLLSIVWLLYSPAASADVLKKGQSVNDAVTAMKKAGYQSVVLEMGPGADFPYPEHNLHSWKVDEGFLNIIYFKTTSKIVRLSFVCHDERVKGDRKVFSFEVIAFDTDTGELRIKTRKEKPVPRREPLNSEDNLFKECPPTEP